MRLAFRRSGRTFTLAAEHVLAAVPDPHVEPLPRAPAALLGMLSWRGQLLGMLDPAPAPSGSPALVAIVTAGDDGLPLALAADVVLGLTAAEHEGVSVGALLAGLGLPAARPSRPP